MIYVIGAGSWGSAIAIHLAKRQPTCLVARDKIIADKLNTSRANEQYLPGISFPEQLTISHIIPSNVKIIVMAVPSHAFEQVLTKIKDKLSTDCIIVCAAKGVVPNSRIFLHDAAASICPNAQFVALAGPSFAKEVARGVPTALTLASEKPCKEIIAAFHHNLIRVYTSGDIIGAEIGGLVKNVIAIAAGASDGIGLGANTRAALLTRGLAEMIRFGTAYGANSQTMMGLSGLGDLILTAGDDQSRNRRFGLYLGQGLSVEQAINKVGQVVEGARNTTELLALAEAKGIDMPIAQAVGQLISGKCSAKDALTELMERDPKAE